MKKVIVIVLNVILGLWNLANALASINGLPDSLMNIWNEYLKGNSLVAIILNIGSIVALAYIFKPSWFNLFPNSEPENNGAINITTHHQSGGIIAQTVNQTINPKPIPRVATAQWPISTNIAAHIPIGSEIMVLAERPTEESYNFALGLCTVLTDFGYEIANNGQPDTSISIFTGPTPRNTQINIDTNPIEITVFPEYDPPIGVQSA